MTPNFAQLIEKAAVLSPAIQEEIILQWFDDIENDTATLQWQKTLEQPQPKLEHVALAALQQSNLKYKSTKSCPTIF